MLWGNDGKKKKFCLLINEMKIKSGLAFSKSCAKLVGFCDLGSVSSKLSEMTLFLSGEKSNSTPELASHAYSSLNTFSFEKVLSTHHQFSTKLMLITARSSTTTQRLCSFKFTLVDKAVHSTARLLSVCRTLFSNFVCMHARSLVPRPKTMVIRLGV